jgi:TonB family protein
LGPAVVGFFNPKIVVPRWLLAAAAADRSAAIAHERSHIAARDSLLLLLGLLLVALMPWNLPLWWQLRKLRFAIEVDCDQRVLSGGASIASYGEMLLAVGQRNSRTPIGAIALTEPSSQLERRIRIMTNGSRPMKLLVLISLAMSGSLMAVAAQLDAPPLSSIAPAVFSASVAAPATSAHENSQAKVELNTAPLDNNATRVSVPARDQSAASVVNATADAPKALAPQQRTKAKAIKLAAADPAAAQPQAAPAVQVRTAVDKAPKRIYTVPPVYPEAAKLANIPGGVVDVAFTAAVTGDVQDAKVVKSEPADVFDEAALTAVRQWRFEPAMKDGQAVPLRFMIRVRFEWPQGASAYTGPSPDFLHRPAGSEQGSAGAATHTGEKLDLTFTDVDVRSVLKTLADTSGQNMVISDKVSGKITLKLMDTPRKDALDIVLRAKKLVMRKEGGIIFIEPAPVAPTAL